MRYYFSLLFLLASFVLAFAMDSEIVWVVYAGLLASGIGILLTALPGWFRVPYFLICLGEILIMAITGDNWFKYMEAQLILFVVGSIVWLGVARDYRIRRYKSYIQDNLPGEPVMACLILNLIADKLRANRREVWEAMEKVLTAGGLEVCRKE